MDLERPNDDCPPSDPAPTPQSQSKKPNQALYVPKQRLHSVKDKAHTQAEVKARPRPRYTDKARKNAKNKKDKAGAAAAAADGDASDMQNNDSKTDFREERLQDSEVLAELTDGHPDVTSQLEETRLQDEEGEEESWDTLFNEDGDCLDLHLAEEVRHLHRSG